MTTNLPTIDFAWEKTGVETPQELRILDEMVNSAMSFVSDMARGEPERWLILVGTSGCGKTHLTDKIRWFLRDYGRFIYDAHCRRKIDPALSRYDSLYSYAQTGALMCKWGTLISKLRSQDYRAFDTAANDWFKAIDDLGVDSFDREGNVTMFSVQKMGELLDRRLKKWTIITTNYSRSQIAASFDARIASRLMRNGNVIVDATGLRDFNVRKEIAKKNN